MYFLEQKVPKTRGFRFPPHPLKNGLAGAFLLMGVHLYNVVVFVNKNLFHLYFYITKPAQHNKSTKSVTWFLFTLKLVDNIQSQTNYSHKPQVSLYFLMTGGKTVCIIFLCWQTVFSPPPEAKVLNKDAGTKVKNINKRNLISYYTLRLLFLTPLRGRFGVWGIGTPELLVLLVTKEHLLYSWIKFYSQHKRAFAVANALLS